MAPDSHSNDKIDTLELILGNKYAMLNDGSDYYPRDASGNEYSTKDVGLIKKNGDYVYPLRQNGKPNYRVENGSEVYEKINNREIIGTGVDGQKYYAVNQNGDEYYADCNEKHITINENQCYATKSNGDHRFPLDEEGNEYYITLVDTEKLRTIPNRYALSYSGDEIYPLRKTFENNESQYIIKNKYAVDRNKKPYYPKDGFKNEYYRRSEVNEPENDQTMNKIVLQKYAVTNDGKIVLPEIRNYYYIDSKKEPKITRKNVIGKLIRDDDKTLDYLTDVSDATFKSLDLKPYSYKKLITNERKLVTPKQCDVNFIGILNASIPFYKNWCFWVFSIVVLIAKVLFVWKFFLKPSQTNKTT